MVSPPPTDMIQSLLSFVKKSFISRPQSLALVLLPIPSSLYTLGPVTKLYPSPLKYSNADPSLVLYQSSVHPNEGAIKPILSFSFIKFGYLIIYIFSNSSFLMPASLSSHSPKFMLLYDQAARPMPYFLNMGLMVLYHSRVSSGVARSITPYSPQ